MQLSEIRDLSRQKADEESTGFVDNGELNSYINQGLKFIYGKIAQRFEDYFIVKGTALNDGLIDVVTNTSAYDLPANLMKLVIVEYRKNGSTTEDDWIIVPRSNIVNDSDKGFYPPRLDWGPIPGFSFFITGNIINLRPEPKSDFQIRLWFVPRVTTLTVDTDVPGIPDEYHELLAEYAAIQLLAKSGESLWQERSSVFKVELDNMLETVENRTQQPEQMNITESYYGLNYWISRGINDPF